MKRKIKTLSVPLIALILMLFSGCSFSSFGSKPVTGNAADPAKTGTEKFQEDKRIYSTDKSDSVVDFYVTVDARQNESDAFYKLNHWYDLHDFTTSGPTLKIIVQQGDEKGPKIGDFGFGANTPNATIEIRGNTTRAAVQKSLKIKFNKNAGLWRGQTVLNLNKHPFDFTRVRNKLSFDYFKLIPNFSSLRTQFVHLHVKDLTSSVSSSSFEDYGLFTEIENPGKRFLAAHGLDSSGQLYKATNFEFFRYPNQLRLSTDPKYDEKAFNQILEIKGSNDHRKLLKMLDAVNNVKLNINDVINQYFDRENYLTWLAVNILMGNIDTSTQNFFLYSPVNSEKFYFMPWDYDGAWGSDNKDLHASWNMGISNYWGTVLHQRFFKDPKNIQDLSHKIEQLSKIITKKQTKEFLDVYYPVVNKFVRSNPDLYYLNGHITDFEKEYSSLPDLPEKNKKAYYESLQKPMPIYLGDPELRGGSYFFSWDPSYDLQGDEVKYDFQVSRTVDFKQIYYEQKGLTDVSLKVAAGSLSKGQNYWRIIIRDAKGNSQIAFDSVEDNNIIYNGIKAFFIK